jgi:hypothetical protein
MKATEVITMGRSRSRQASQRGFDDALALEFEFARKLDDQDSVLASEAHQHDEPYLDEGVVVAAIELHAGQGREHAHRNDQDHREREHPALIERRQLQEGEQN